MELDAASSANTAGSFVHAMFGHAKTREIASDEALVRQTNKVGKRLLTQQSRQTNRRDEAGDLPEHLPNATICRYAPSVNAHRHVCTIRTYIYICRYANAYIHIYTHSYSCIYTYKYVNMYIYI